MNHRLFKCLGEDPKAYEPEILNYLKQLPAIPDGVKITLQDNSSTYSQNLLFLAPNQAEIEAVVRSSAGYIVDYCRVFAGRRFPEVILEFETASP